MYQFKIETLKEVSLEYLLHHLLKRIPGQNLHLRLIDYWGTLFGVGKSEYITV